MYGPVEVSDIRKWWSEWNFLQVRYLDPTRKNASPDRTNLIYFEVYGYSELIIFPIELHSNSTRFGG